jgi:hypothetical protein
MERYIGPAVATTYEELVALGAVVMQGVLIPARLDACGAKNHTLAVRMLVLHV